MKKNIKASEIVATLPTPLVPDEKFARSGGHAKTIHTGEILIMEDHWNHGPVKRHRQIIGTVAVDCRSPKNGWVSHSGGESNYADLSEVICVGK